MFERNADEDNLLKMKKFLLLLVSITLVTSCGPHRMRCGARGICKAHHYLKSMEVKEHTIVFNES